MAGIPIVTKTGPKTFTPAEGQVITGGNVVEAVDGGRIGVASAGSEKVLGVAVTDAVAPEDAVTAVTGTPPTVAAVPRPTLVAVAYSPQEVPVVYDADAEFGERLTVADDGKVTPGDEPQIGICTEPGGVTVAENPVGLMRLSV